MGSAAEAAARGVGWVTETGRVFGGACAVDGDGVTGGGDAEGGGGGSGGGGGGDAEGGGGRGGDGTSGVGGESGVSGDGASVADDGGAGGGGDGASGSGGGSTAAGPDSSAAAAAAAPGSLPLTQLSHGHAFEVEAHDMQSLLFAFLDELLFQFSTSMVRLSRFAHSAPLHIAPVHIRLLMVMP